MTRLPMLLTCVAVWALLSTWASADAPLIGCIGTESGGNGPRLYAYEVDSASYPMVQFMVGTNDLDSRHYTNVLIPPGWRFAVEPVPMAHMHTTKTPHGRVSPGPCRCLTQGRVRWWANDPADAIEFFTFGFDHPWPSEDVDWILETRRENPPLPPELRTFRADWDAAVGWGYGPVHAPVPEPTTLGLLGAGAVSLLFLGGLKAKLRKRNKTRSG